MCGLLFLYILIIGFLFKDFFSFFMFADISASSHENLSQAFIYYLLARIRPVLTD